MLSSGATLRRVCSIRSCIFLLLKAKVLHRIWSHEIVFHSADEIILAQLPTLLARYASIASDASQILLHPWLAFRIVIQRERASLRWDWLGELGSTARAAEGGHAVAPGMMRGDGEIVRCSMLFLRRLEHEVCRDLVSELCSKYTSSYTRHEITTTFSSEHVDDGGFSTNASGAIERP